LEQRISLLEKSLGAQIFQQETPRDIFSTLQTLENRLDMLNDKNLDTLSTRIHALMKDFNLLNKIRESSVAQQSVASVEESEKISKIYDKLEVSSKYLCYTIFKIITRINNCLLFLECTDYYCCITCNGRQITFLK